MTSTKANIHAMVAVAAIIGAEFGKLADDTPVQMAAHNWAYYVVLVAAIIVGIGNSFASTSAPTSQDAVTLSPPPSPPKPQAPLSPAPQPNPPSLP